MRRAFSLLALAALFSSGWRAAAQSHPAGCESIPDGLLGGLAAPYTRQVAPDGTAYCEGLIRIPIALLPPTVISIKQNPLNDPVFRRSETASLTWCGDPKDALHISLRSTLSPWFALDATHSIPFEWKTDEIATWQPNWKNLAALASHNFAIQGKNYLVLIPLRTGPGYSSDYSFILHSKDPVHLTKALLQPVELFGKPSIVDVSFSNGPSKNTWTTVIPFKKMKEGIYQITFEEGVDSAGSTADPIYLFHKTCATQ
jgi:hypothetical protein